MGARPPQGRIDVHRSFVAIAATAVLVAGGAFAADAATSSKEVSACADKSNHLALSVHGHCTAGHHKVSVPDVAVRGKRGPQGPRGVAGPYPASLPSHRTITGAWAAGNTAVGATVGSSQFSYSASTFAFPFATAPTPVIIYDAADNEDPVHCTGTPAAPAAAPGYLCVYVSYSKDIDTLSLYDPATANFGAASKFGWGLVAKSTNGGNVVAQGTWAATAP
jgi:hypothetical protein